MKETIRVAAIQMGSGEDKESNLAAAARLTASAVDAGAKIVALPEMFNCLGTHEVMVAQAEAIPGRTSEFLGDLARRHRITLIGGSFAERADDGHVYNASLLFSPTGMRLTRYRKQHLFDVNLASGLCVEESRWFSAGEGISAEATPLGCIGLAICYDLRFPELFRELSGRGAEIIVLPSAFTAATGRAHWEILVRARAIENQVYVIAPNQCGEPVPGVSLYGHTMIVDPWGEILAEAAEEPEGQQESVLCADISFHRLRDLRAQLPVQAHRKLGTGTRAVRNPS